jgi:hypothetical protein
MFADGVSFPTQTNNQMFSNDSRITRTRLPHRMHHSHASFQFTDLGGMAAAPDQISGQLRQTFVTGNVSFTLTDEQDGRVWRSTVVLNVLHPDTVCSQPDHFFAFAGFTAVCTRCPDGQGTSPMSSQCNGGWALGWNRHPSARLSVQS